MKIVNDVEIKLSNPQYGFVTSESKFCGLSGGWKSGKTYGSANRCCYILKLTGQSGIMAEPTYRMARDILKPALYIALNEWGITYRESKSDNIIHTQYGDILIRTMENRSALEGHNIGWFGLDEIDLKKKEDSLEVWRVLISKLTLGKKQYGWVTGTNEGYEFMYDKFVKDAEITEYGYKRGEYELYTTSTYDNEINLPEGHIKSMEEDYDEKLIDRYIHGKFIMLGGMNAAYNYSEKNFRYIEPTPILKSALLFDFNVNPMTCLFNQETNHNEWCYTNEFIYEESNTERTCDAVLEYFDKIGYNAPLIISGDYTGAARHTDSNLTNWAIIEKKFEKYHPKVIRQRTHSVRDRLNCLNAGFGTTAGVIRQYVNPNNCKKLHEDLIRTKLTDDGRNIDDKNSKRGHQVDAMSYFDMNLYPIRLEKQSRSY